jgi:hypothetical protein
MHRLVATLAVATVLAVAPVAHAQRAVQVSPALVGIKLTASTLNGLVGHSTCELPRETGVGRFTLPVRSMERALEYRRAGTLEMVLVLHDVDANTVCGTIVGVLRLPKSRKDEAIGFDCRIRGETVRAEPTIGLVNNQRGVLRYVVPRRAWVVNLDTGQCQSREHGVVICDTMGYRQ